ncbi:MAG: AzlC family ABC transporter permease [Agathobacter sp.]|nr:AzlC family ABC transporter permease [Agathobacter sp.]
MKNSIQTGIKDGIPVALGYFAVSFTFGMAVVSDGFSVWHAVLISLTNVTSAGQFAGLSIIAAGGSLWEMALTQLIINLRYCLMSFSLAQKLDKKTKNIHRFIMAFGVTDEIFALGASCKGKLRPSYHYGIMAIAIPGWVAGTFVGGVFGNILPAFIMSALGIAIYGMFLAIILPPAKKDKSILLVVLAAMAISGLFAITPVLKKVSSGFVIIITTILVAGIAAKLKPISEENENEQ